MTRPLNCPICEPDNPSAMQKTPHETPELENGVSLTCPACGFCLIAKNNTILTAAYNCLWDYPPEGI